MSTLHAQEVFQSTPHPHFMIGFLRASTLRGRSEEGVDRQSYDNAM